MDSRSIHQRRELPGIHLLRLAASLVIAAYHVDISGIAATHLPALGALAGPRAVAPSVTSLFLTLSGFALFYADATRRTPRQRPAAEFWRARAARLVPLMLVGHLLVMPFELMGRSQLGAGEAVVRAGLVATATQSWFPRYALSYNGPAWTLSVIAFGYLLYPWFAARVVHLGPRTAASCLAGVWAASIGVSRLILLGGDGPADAASLAHDFVHVFPPVRVLEFASGVLLGRLWIASRGRFTGTWAAVAVAPAALLVAALATGSLHPQPAALLGYGGLMPLWWMLIWLIAAVTVTPTHALRWQRLGRASFAVYILHVPLLVVVNAMLYRGWFGASGGVALALWFVALVPVGLAAERWFVAPMARRLQAPHAQRGATPGIAEAARGVAGGTLPPAPSWRPGVRASGESRAADAAN